MTVQTKKARIFISYSHSDQKDCKKIAAILEEENLDVWYDKGLVPGEVYRKKIAEVIAETDFFMILVSSSSIRSEWVIDELEYAKKLHKRILPVWIEKVDIPQDLDMILQRYHSLFWYLRAADEEFQGSIHSIFHNDDIGSRETPSVGFGNEFSEADNLRMRDLLDKEKQEQFAFCYQPENACYLGMAYLFGGPCGIDREKAAFYFRTAEYFGNNNGTCFLLQMKLEDRRSDTWDDPDETFCKPIVEQIHDLADAGSLYAKLFLGNLYWYGIYGCAVDKEKSAALYEECAKAGNARAQYLMAANYYYGDGVNRDYQLAKMFANLALAQKYFKSWRRWGKFYRDGLAVEQNYRKARECYEKGAKMGDYNCYNKIGDMLYYGWGFPVDYAAAFACYQEGEKAPLYGQQYCLQKAKMALGRCLEEGCGTEQNLKAACEKYLEGYRCGSSDCKEAYLRLSAALYGERH